jgi:hypothetical protein
VPTVDGVGYGIGTAALSMPWHLGKLD